jgi:hypothetical protein
MLFSHAFDQAEHIGDVQRQIDVWMQQVRPLAEASERRREYNIAARSQPVGDAAPAPASVPGAVNKDEGFRTHLARFQICVATPPPPEGAALITCNSSPLTDNVRFCV